MLPKELTTVTPLSKAVALVLFITLPIVAFIAGMNYQKKITTPYYPTPTVTPTVTKPYGETPVPTNTVALPTPECLPGTTEQIYINADHQLTDTINGYSLDFSLLPQADVNDTLHCPNKYYEVDMYPKRPEDDGSVARLSVQAPFDNSSHMSLIEYAKQKMNYIEGKHVDPSDNYGLPFSSSAIVEKTFPSGIKSIQWTDIYAEYETHQEGLTAAKFYLLEVDNKIIKFYVMAWDMPALQLATADFDKVVETFTLLKEIPAL